MLLLVHILNNNLFLNLYLVFLELEFFFVHKLHQKYNLFHLWKDCIGIIKMARPFFLCDIIN